MRSLFADLAKLESEGRPFVLGTVVAQNGSTPQKTGAQVVVLADGSIRGTIGGGAIEKQIVEAALSLLSDGGTSSRLIETHLTHDLGMCCGGSMTVFLQKHGRPATLVLFGAGHVAQALSQVAWGAGFELVVIDERPEWLTEARFPQANRRLLAPDFAASQLETTTDMSCCVVTHDHQLDQRCLEALLRKPLAYLGVIGSERKAHRFRQRLEAAGFTREECTRFECPMGLDIGALTPMEIAISTLARLITIRRKHLSSS